MRIIKLNLIDAKNRAVSILAMVAIIIITGGASIVVSNGLDKVKSESNIGVAQSGLYYCGEIWEANTGWKCNWIGDPPEGKMWACINTVCVYRNINQGGGSCYLSQAVPPVWSSCGCDKSGCENRCKSAHSGSPGHYTRRETCSNCGQYFTCGCTINAPPPTPTLTPTPNPVPATAVINITQLNTVDNCTTWSGALLGNDADVANNALLNQFNKTNNPLTFTTQFTDNNGIRTIGEMRVWFSGSTNINTNPKIGGRFQRNSSNRLNFYLNGAWTSVSTSGSAAICTKSGGSQVSCNVDTEGVPDIGDAIGYIKPINITEAANVITVTWKVGIPDLGKTFFSSSLGIHAYATDNAGGGQGAQVNRNWQIDYMAPNATLSADPSSNAGDLVYEITYTSSDNNGLKFAQPRATQDGLLPAEGFTVSSPGYTHNFTSTTDGNPSDGSGDVRYPFFGSYPGTLQPAVEYTFTNINITDATLGVELVAQDVACNETTSVSETLYMGLPWLMTTDGTVYSDQVSERIFPDRVSAVSNTLPFYDAETYASTYSYIYQNSNSGINKESLYDYSFGQYTDLNYEPRQNSVGKTWFAYIKDSLARSVDLGKAGYKNYGDPPNAITDLNLHVQALKNTTSELVVPDEIDITDINVITIPGTLTIESGIICDTRTVFVSQDLVIVPDFRNASYDTGCIFIVGGTTTITGGDDLNSTTTHTDYNYIDAFIITNKIMIENDVNQDGLIIKGGVIIDTNDDTVNDITFETNKNSDFLRELMIISNLNSPSEVVIYDGVRYMYVFDDLFYYPPKYTIREKQFIQLNSVSI